MLRPGAEKSIILVGLFNRFNNFTWEMDFLFKRYAARLKNEFHGYNAAALGKDVMAGLTVTAVALPLALAFGVSCGASAAAGLVTAILAGLIISALSGASYQISGPTGAMSAILIGIVAKDGLQNVFIVSFLAGGIMLLCALFKLGRLVRMIPRPVITGFTSGIAVIIALGQVDNFFGTVSEGGSALEKLVSYGHLGFKPDVPTVLLGLLVVVVMIVWPKKWGAVVPASLVGIILSTAVSVVFRMDVATVGEIPKTLFLSDRLNFAAFDMAKLGSYLSPAVSIAALGIIESLLCGASASRMKNESFDADVELVAQGVGNMIIPLFGGVPATAAIARTSVAIKSGCVTRVCGIVHALGLLASMFLLGPVMALLPLSALAGVLMVTAWRMNEWSSIRYFFGKGFRGACAKFLITMLATVVFDLTVAILIGIGFSAVLFILRSSKLSTELAKVENDRFRGEANVESTHGNAYVLYVTGPIFFLNVGALEQAVAAPPSDCGEYIFSMRGVPAVDTTGVAALDELVERLQNRGVRVLFCGLNDNVRAMLERGGVLTTLGENAVFRSVDRALLEV